MLKVCRHKKGKQICFSSIIWQQFTPQKYHKGELQQPLIHCSKKRESPPLGGGLSFNSFDSAHGLERRARAVCIGPAIAHPQWTTEEEAEEPVIYLMSVKLKFTADKIRSSLNYLHGPGSPNATFVACTVQWTWKNLDWKWLLWVVFARTHGTLCNFK